VELYSRRRPSRARRCLDSNVSDAALPSLSGVILGGFFTLAITLAFRLWQNERDRWTTRVDAFCDVVTEAADLGVEYWIEAGEDGQKPRDQKREIQLLGFQARLDGLLVTFLEKFTEADQIDAAEKLGQFREAITGGEFQSISVKADQNRARDVQMTANELFVALRQAADRAMRWTPFARRYPPFVR
jgi:hypothetical protein